ncbi:GNAT family N-acetyltransferase [Halobellus sp. Atlit-31R]|nr:GNAT family N-acetyltransferase [Halobellus sp. Atlit-31R]
MGIQTRHATEADGEEILDLWHGFTAHLSQYDERYTHTEEANDRWLQYFENQLVDSKYGTVLLAESDEADEPIGVLEARVMGDHPIFQLANHGYVNGLFVREGHREQGAASKMLEAAAEWFTEEPRGVDYYRIDVLAGDEGAAAMLEAYGLEPVEHVYEQRL